MKKREKIALKNQMEKKYRFATKKWRRKKNIDFATKNTLLYAACFGRQKKNIDLHFLETKIEIM